MGDVVILDCDTTLPVPVDRVLDAAKKLETVLVLGWDADGQFYAACSNGSMESATYMAQKFIYKVHSGDYA